MKITYCCNFVNHHIEVFLFELFAIFKENFTVIVTMALPEEQRNLGYDEMNIKYPFIIKSYENKEAEKKAFKLAIESEVVIFGIIIEDIIKERRNKINFIISERFLKQTYLKLLHPLYVLKILKRHGFRKNKNSFLLSASAFAAFDFSLLRLYKNRAYKFGYFPEVKNYNLESLFLRKINPKPKILWCSRYLKLKHPEKVIELAEQLLQKGMEFEINMVGSGPLETKIKTLIAKKQLTDYIKLQGAVSYHEVRSFMEEANIFIFTSNRNEGWGAVVNEAMGSGCAVIAYHLIGSVPFLLHHDNNGLIYRHDKELLDYTIKCLQDADYCKKLGFNALKTITEVWNGKKAAKNFIKLLEGKLNNQKDSITEGPCSKAPRIRHDWFLKTKGNIEGIKEN
ncbi:MAG: glycosyltransferase [Erysipelotrichales bacterium]|nr:glycosyltransferase [Erysipelotrichales bacterium]